MRTSSGAIGAPCAFFLFAVLSACADPVGPAAAGQATVSNDLSLPASSLRLQFGRGWEMPSSTTSVGPMGEFRLPPSTRLATIFADLNGNKALDRFAEPSSPCVHDGRQWSCRLDATRLSIHRLVRTNTDSVLQDRTMAIVEVYDDAGDPILDVQLCEEGGACAVPTTGPYASVEPGMLLGLCDLEQGVAERVEVTFARPGVEPVSFQVGQPPALSLESASARLASGALQVRADTDLPMDRALVWLGEFDEDRLVQMHASSEQADSQLRLAGRSVSAVLPAVAVDRCVRSSRCRLVVQVAGVVEGASVPTITQAERFFEVL